MQSAKSIMLHRSRLRFTELFFSVLFLCFSFSLLAQSNSPYSRFGLGDLSSSVNVTSRGMGGIAAGYADIVSVNFSNPASYSQFFSIVEPRSKRLASGRIVLDVGVSAGSRSLIEPNTINRFTSSDLAFSYLQLGLPLRKNWGLSFGIRPVSRIGYLIDHDDSLHDPVTGNTIERALTQFRGSGGSYLPSIGTGFAIKNFSAGINVGYLFGNRESTTLRSLINNSVQYYSSQHTTNSSFGNVFLDAGIQYAATLKKDNEGATMLRLGISGNWKQTLKGSQDILRQTYAPGASGEELRIDSVYEKNGARGEVIYPASYKAGFTLQHNDVNGRGWLFGVDYTQSKWSEFRFFGQADSVQDNHMLNVGGQFSPRAQSNYFSRVAYRFGFFTGQDYIKVQDKLPIAGASFGVALPVRPSRLAPNQFSFVNLGLEYIKRGNNNNLLKENLFRVSLGLNLTDFWFGKHPYE